MSFSEVCQFAFLKTEHTCSQISKHVSCSTLQMYKFITLPLARILAYLQFLSFLFQLTINENNIENKPDHPKIPQRNFLQKKTKL